LLSREPRNPLLDAGAVDCDERAVHRRNAERWLHDHRAFLTTRKARADHWIPTRGHVATPLARPVARLSVLLGAEVAGETEERAGVFLRLSDQKNWHPNWHRTGQHGLTSSSMAARDIAQNASKTGHFKTKRHRPKWCRSL